MRPGLPGAGALADGLREQPRPDALPAVVGCHDQVQQVAVDDREPGARLEGHLELVGVVSQPAPGALVEGLDPVRLGARPADVLDRSQPGVVHLGDSRRQASWESRTWAGTLVFSTVGITNR